MQQITYTHTVTAHLVCISRANAFACRTDLSTTFRCLICGIQDAVGGQDQVRFLRDIELLGDVVTAGSQGLSLLLKQQRIQYYTVTDHIDFSSLENTGRDGA